MAIYHCQLATYRIKLLCTHKYVYEYYWFKKNAARKTNWNKQM